MKPRAVRASAQGLTRNLGRGCGAVAPFLVDAIGARYGLGSAFVLTSASFLFAGLVAHFLPETRGRELQ